MILWIHVAFYLLLSIESGESRCNPIEECGLHEWVGWQCDGCCKPNAPIDSARQPRKMCCPNGLGLSECLQFCNITLSQVERKGLCTEHCACPNGFHFATTIVPITVTPEQISSTVMRHTTTSMQDYPTTETIEQLTSVLQNSPNPSGQGTLTPGFLPTTISIQQPVSPGKTTNRQPSGTLQSSQPMSTTIDLPSSEPTDTAVTLESTSSSQKAEQSPQTLLPSVSMGSSTPFEKSSSTAKKSAIITDETTTISKPTNTLSETMTKGTRPYDRVPFKSTSEPRTDHTSTFPSTRHVHSTDHSTESRIDNLVSDTITPTDIPTPHVSSYHDGNATATHSTIVSKPGTNESTTNNQSETASGRGTDAKSQSTCLQYATSSMGIGNLKGIPFFITLFCIGVLVGALMTTAVFYILRKKTQRVGVKQGDSIPQDEVYGKHHVNKGGTRPTNMNIQNLDF